MDNHGIDPRTPENVIVCSGDEDSIIRSIPRDDISDLEEAIRQSNLQRYDTAVQNDVCSQRQAYIGLPSGQALMQRQIRNFTLRVSLDTFCRADSSNYIPEWDRVEHLITMVMPIFREYFTSVVGANIRFVDGVFQLDGSACGLHRNLHIQGCFRVAEKITLLGIRRHFNGNFNNSAPYMIFQGAEITPVVHTSFDECMRECRNTDTQLGGPWFFGTVATYRGQDIIPKHKLWLWQEQLVNLIIRSASRARHGIFDNRRVLFFVDELGGTGKSTVSKFLDYYGLAAVYNCLTVRDALHLIAEDKPQSCYVFEVTRCWSNDVTFEEMACTIESLKNGTVVSTKYAPTKRLQHPATVVVFSSTFPSPSQLKMVSRDRWQIIRLTQRHIPIDVRQQRVRNREFQEDQLLFNEECLYESLSNSEGEQNEGNADLSTQLREQIVTIAQDAHIEGHIIDAMYSAAVRELLERQHTADVDQLMVVDNGQSSRPDPINPNYVPCDMVCDDERGRIYTSVPENAQRQLQQCDQPSQDGNYGGPIGHDEGLCTHRNSRISNGHDNLGHSSTRCQDCGKAESSNLSSHGRLLKFAESVDTLLYCCYEHYTAGEDVPCAMHEVGDTIANQQGQTVADTVVAVPDLILYPTTQTTTQGERSSKQQVEQSIVLYGDNVERMDEDQPICSVPVVFKVEDTGDQI